MNKETKLVNDPIEFSVVLRLTDTDITSLGLNSINFKINNKMDKERQDPKYTQNPKLGISVVMQRALDWWNELPMQNIYDCRNGWANLVMVYYPNRGDCQNVSIEEILYMYVREQGM